MIPFQLPFLRDAEGETRKNHPIAGQQTVQVVQIDEKQYLGGWDLVGACLCYTKVVDFFLEEQSSHTAYFTLFLDKDLKVLVDDGDGQQDSSARTNGSKEVSHHRQTTNTEATEGCSSRNVPVEFMDHGGLPVTPHHHLLFLQLFCHIFSRRARHLNPGLGEKGTGSQHENNVDAGVDWVIQDIPKRLWRREVVA